MAASIEQVNMTEGALLPKVLRFSLPLAATGVLQLLFNAADVLSLIHISMCIRDSSMAAFRAL